MEKAVKEVKSAPAITLADFEAAQSALHAEINAAIAKYEAIDPSFRIVSGYLQVGNSALGESTVVHSTVAGVVGDAEYHRTQPFNQA